MGRQEASNDGHPTDNHRRPPPLKDPEKASESENRPENGKPWRRRLHPPPPSCMHTRGDWCGGWDSNPRTPKRQEPQSCAFDHAGRPPHAQHTIRTADLSLWDGAAAGNRTPSKGSTVPYATITPQRPRKQQQTADQLKGFRGHARPPTPAGKFNYPPHIQKRTGAPRQSSHWISFRKKWDPVQRGGYKLDL